MVFSQTSQKTHSILKVVDLSHVKTEKNQQVDGITGVVTAVDAIPGPSSSPANSFSEEFLKSEPEFESIMHRDTDCEFFQDLGLWCSATAKDEPIQTIDTFQQNTEKQKNADTLYTQFPFAPTSPPTPASLYPAGRDPLSPADGFQQYDSKFFYPDLGNDKKMFQEQFLDISSLPVVIGELEQGLAEPDLGPSHWDYTHTEHTHTPHETPFIHQEDSMDMKLATAVMPRDVQWNDVVVDEYVLGPRRPALSLDVRARPPPAALGISTPDVLNYVEQLENETTMVRMPTPAEEWPVASATPAPPTPTASDCSCPSPGSRRKRRRLSSDSDSSYRPSPPASPARRRRRRPALSAMIQALEEAQPAARARRGRPPKRRPSAASSGDASGATVDLKYREVRDKNNEASKRSRMNRKLKELQMEQLVIDLEERNDKLRVKADILEDMTKRLKDALMTAMLKPSH